MSKNIPPFRFQPQFQYRLWGGGKLKTKLNKNCKDKGIGESWEISAVDGFPSVIEDGQWKGKTLPEMIAAFPEAILGKKCIASYGNTFPLLIKFIDALLPLSVQVHPNDELAKMRHNASGKNEMWYILDADPDAELILGFNQNIDAEQYAGLLAEDRIEEVLHREKVTAGDVVNVPAGLIHAIGGGVLLAEIQQSSDITYRVYDFNRIDAKTGETRELHTQQAIDALDFSAHKKHKINYSKDLNRVNTILKTAYFTTAFLPIEGAYPMDYSKRAAFSILICIDGTLTVTSNDHILSLEKGQCVLIPAALNEVVFQGKAQLLDVTV